MPSLERLLSSAHARTGVVELLGPPLHTGDPYSGTPVHGGVYTNRLVERPAVALPDNPKPDFPAAMRSARIEGEVLVTFVVDTLGRVERGSIVIVSATHRHFADAVERWLPRTRYHPAEVTGQPVRQLVQQMVDFTLR